ncbi:MAG: L-seryl-tRNA(Sec) selenium transferase [Dehalococcoidaceae bacterium]|nr:L-seryl-tRNA(Sec) selenium transferase [Dehalococcoidaceae bacterium]
MNEKANQVDKETLNREMRKLPQVEILLTSPDLAASIKRYSRPLVMQAIQRVLSTVRSGIAGGGTAPAMDGLVQDVKEDLAKTWPGFRSPVINATGVVLHTNLGRAPMPPAALEAISELCGQFSVLEYDLVTGKRGRRAQELERLLCILTGAEAALVVNNNAAAVLLILVALANGREAIVSRGELVQIGGGFRVPEIMTQSGVTLREVGTTNQTYLEDYAKAINENTGILLKVHRSNFALRGFTSEVTVAELKALGNKHSLPVVYDVGSGAFFDTEEYGMEHEPSVPDAINENADIICFSGDKLFGGAQAGIIIGKKEYIDKLRKHQLLRAVRIDKMATIALETVVMHYLNKETREKVPVWQMMGYSAEEIGRRAEIVAGKLAEQGIAAEVKPGLSMVGGGSLPDQTLPTTLIAIKPEISLDAFSNRLRFATPPVIGRIEDERFLVDLRTVFAHQEEQLMQKILETAR